MTKTENKVLVRLVGWRETLVALVPETLALVRSDESFLNGLAKVRIIKSGAPYEGYINHEGRYVIKPMKKKKVTGEHQLRI